MPDRTEELRRFISLKKAAERANSDYFESQVEAFYHAQNRSVISWGEESHVALLAKYKIPFQMCSLADFIVDDSPTSIIVAEAKGKEIDHALEQLANLARYVGMMPPHRGKEIKLHIHLREGANPNNLAPAENQDVRYFARPVLETVLRRPKYSLLSGGSNSPVRVALSRFEPGHRVFVFIGPGDGTRR